MTLAAATGLLKRATAAWEIALEQTEKTGDWTETDAHHRLSLEFEDLVASALHDGDFEGDREAALKGWLALVEIEQFFRGEQTEIVQLRLRSAATLRSTDAR